MECASVQGQVTPRKPPLKSIMVGGSLKWIGMDFLGMSTAKSGNIHALVSQDYLSKCPDVYPMMDWKVETTARCLLDLLWKHGVPSQIYMIVQQSSKQKCGTGGCIVD